MDVEILARLQFAFTISFHYIYPPLSIGLGLIMVITEGMFLKTGDEEYKHLTRFWTKMLGGCTIPPSIVSSVFAVRLPVELYRSAPLDV